jgi:hypothetical protein
VRGKCPSGKKNSTTPKGLGFRVKKIPLIRVVEQTGFLDPEYLFFSVSGCVLSVVEHYEFSDP